MIKVIKYDEVVDMLKAIVAGKEDFVYERVESVCLYWTNGEDGTRDASCLVGHVFQALGVLSDLPLWYQNSDANVTVGVLKQKGVINFTRKARALLMAAQGRQDEGTPWGEAVQEALADKDVKFAADTI